MKQLWTEPVVEVETFAVENVMTDSGYDVGGESSSGEEFEGPIISL